MSAAHLILETRELEQQEAGLSQYKRAAKSMTFSQDEAGMFPSRQAHCSSHGTSSR